MEEIAIVVHSDSDRNSNADSIVAISIKKPSKRSPDKLCFLSPEKKSGHSICNKSPIKSQYKTPGKISMFPLQEL